MLKRLVCLASVVAMASLGAAEAQDAPWGEAAANGELNRQMLLACQRFVDGWLQHADPATGLIPRNLNKDFYWNAKDAAADNYPFMVITTFYTNKAMYNGRMRDMLETEQRVTNRVDRLPDDFLFATQAFRVPEPKMDDLIFGASEYAKDGLIPVTEILGQTAWTDRMIGLIDDIWKHAAIETEAGLLPSVSHEVCGELLQTQSRLYWLTGNEAYRDQVFRLASYFFDHHPPEQAEALRLDDHGCEVVSGLSEAYYLAAKTDPDRQAAWRPAMHRLLDRILEVGRDDNGLLWNLINPVTGEVLSEERTDNWGYNYSAYLVVDALDDVPAYREAVAFALSNLMKNKDYAWEGDIADGIADSLEGGLNLMNRIPSGEAAQWADHMAQRLLSKQRDTGVVAGWHGDGNFARTALMYALWKSQGAWVEPWRNDLRVGAVTAEDGTVYLEVSAEWPWQGVVRFDRPRHTETLHIPTDYPRLNQFPEWFVVSADDALTVNDENVTGETLRDGYAITAGTDAPARLTIKRKES